MSCIDSFVIAVPTANEQKFIEQTHPHPAIRPCPSTASE